MNDLENLISDLETEILFVIREKFCNAVDRFEDDTSVTLLQQMGPVQLIHVVLWSEDMNDLALATLLHRVIRPFEILVEKYPSLLLRQARTYLQKFFLGG